MADASTHRQPSHAAKTAEEWAQVEQRLERATGSAPVDRSAEDHAAVLRRRSELFARPLESEHAASEDEVQCLTFDLGGQIYAIEATSAREALRAETITPLPGLPVPLRGLVNVRSRIVPAYDLRSLLRLPPAAVRERETVVIVSCNEAEFGLLVDAVRGTQAIRWSGLRSDVVGLQAQYLRGISEDGLLLLDLLALVPVLTVDDRGS